MSKAVRPFDTQWPLMHRGRWKRMMARNRANAMIYQRVSRATLQDNEWVRLLLHQGEEYR